VNSSPDAVSDVPRFSRRDFAIVFSVSLVSAIGQTGLLSVLPTIGRSIGIEDAMLTGMSSLGAIFWTVSSPFWARQSDLRGRKSLMVVGLGGLSVSMMLCGVTVSAGLAHLATPVMVFGFLLAGRAIFGLFGAATNPASQAYIAERTSPAERTRSMSNVTAGYGLGTVVGPMVAPQFIVGVVGLAGPLYAFGSIGLLMLLIVWRYLDEAPTLAAKPPSHTDNATGKPPSVVPTIAPFLAYGFLLLSCRYALAQNLGFLLIDKTAKTLPRLASTELLQVAQSHIQTAMVCGALASLVALWGLIPMFRMRPKALLRWGAGLGSLGTLLIALSPNHATVIVGYVFSSLGFTLALQGLSVGVSLSVPMWQQARAAGALGVIAGMDVLFAPFAVSLYRHFAPGPFLLEAVVLAILVTYACLNPMLRNVGNRVNTEASD